MAILDARQLGATLAGLDVERLGASRTTATTFTGASSTSPSSTARAVLAALLDGLSLADVVEPIVDLGQARWARKR